MCGYATLFQGGSRPPSPREHPAGGNHEQLEHAAQDFLAQRRVAVVGVSRSSGEAANIVYRKLRDSGYQVYPVNPNREQVEGAPCFPTLSAIPGGVDAVVIATNPEVVLGIVRECADLGIERVWMHRSFGKGSVSDEAVTFCRDRAISVIPGACPLMFLDRADVPHRCMRWILGHTGGLPETALVKDKQRR